MIEDLEAWVEFFRRHGQVRSMVLFCSIGIGIFFWWFLCLYIPALVENVHKRKMAVIKIREAEILLVKKLLNVNSGRIARVERLLSTLGGIPASKLRLVRTKTDKEA